MSALENGDRLSSWKEIAAHFGKDERTVKRWESQRGLPVHRLPGGTGTVYAYARELDDWLHQAGSRPGNGGAVNGAATGDPPVEATPPPAASAVGRGAAILRRAALGLVIVAASGAAAFAALHFGGVFDRPPPALARKGHTPTPAVADLYNRGIYYWSKRTPDDLNRAIHLFNQAIAEDPSYAQAFVGLANCYNLLREYTLMPAAEAYPKAKAAAERAIALDDTLADAYTSLAFSEFFWFWNAAKARALYDRALRLQPDSAQTRHWFATALMYSGEYERSLAEIGRAQDLDPKSRAILADKGLILYYSGREQESVDLLRQIASAEPDYLAPYAYLAAIYFAQGHYVDHFVAAKHAARRLKDDDRLSLVEATEAAYAAGGVEALKAALLDGERRLYAEGRQEAYWLARTYAFAGDMAKALEYLRVSIDRHDQSALILRMDPAFRTLRQNETFRNMVVEVGLPPLT